MDEIKTLTAEGIQAIEHVLDIDPDLIDENRLDKYSGLSEELIRHSFRGYHTPSLWFCLGNKLTEDQFLKVIKGATFSYRKYDDDFPWDTFFLKVGSYDSDKIRMSILGKKELAMRVLNNTEELFGASRVDVLSQIIEMDENGTYKKNHTGRRGTHTYNDSPLDALISGSMLSEEEKELLIEQGHGDSLFRTQFLFSYTA